MVFNKIGHDGLSDCQSFQRTGTEVQYQWSSGNDVAWLINIDEHTIACLLLSTALAITCCMLQSLGDSRARYGSAKHRGAVLQRLSATRQLPIRQHPSEASGSAATLSTAPQHTHGHMNIMIPAAVKTKPQSAVGSTLSC